MRHQTLRAMTLATLVGLGAAACGSSGSGGSTGPGNTTVTQAEAQAAGALGASYANGTIGVMQSGSFGISGLPALAARAPGSASDPQAVLATALQAAGLRGPALGLAGAPPLYLSSSACVPVLSGDVTSGHPTDTDGDGIPDSVIATFAAGNCTVFDSAANSTFTFSGTMKVVDIGTLYGFRLVLNLTYTLTSPSESAHITSGGTETFTVSSTVADLLNNISIYDTISASGHTVAVVAQVNVHFVFTSGGTPIVWGNPLPDGSMAITGHYGVSEQGQQGLFAFDVATPTPLAYSAACEAASSTPPFTAGHLVGTFTGAVGAGFSVTYTACGTQPTVTGTGTT